MNKPPTVRLKPNRERSVVHRHPWVFSGAIDKVDGDPALGSLVAVRDSEGAFLAWGHYSPHSQIRVRLVSWNEPDEVDTPAFLEHRITQACAFRSQLAFSGPTTAYRIVNAESDGVPGLIVDRYDRTVVVQLLAAGTEVRRDLLTSVLWNVLQPDRIYERSDADARQKEGLQATCGLLRGDPVPERIRILENGLHFWVDIQEGHKTGAYLDQRENRQTVRDWVRALALTSRSVDVLNVFSYTAGFAVYSLAGDASAVTNIDTSQRALSLGRANIALNGLPQSRCYDIASDAFTAMRKLIADGLSYDVIILDPPKFAANQKEIQRAARGYKDANLQAFQLLKPQGLLFTFSCSGSVSADLFQKIVFGAALDSGRRVQIIGYLHQSQDHPTLLSFPEGAYLKGLICRSVD